MTGCSDQVYFRVGTETAMVPGTIRIVDFLLGTIEGEWSSKEVETK